MRSPLIDYHLHSQFSADSKADPVQIIERALEIGYSEIAFTEHYDKNPVDVQAYGEPPHASYKTKIQELKAVYEGRITILCGFEVGEMHRFPYRGEVMDLLIGSIHRTSEDQNLSDVPRFPFTEKMIDDYYEENLTLAETGGFDILGHLGIYMRYDKEIPDITARKPVMEKIFQALIRQEIALEINFSGVRKTLGAAIPVLQILCLYRQCGGKLLTFGSDAHVTQDIGVGHAQAFDTARECGFTRFHSKDKGMWQEHSL
ncbi:MAG TPA: histidinol-phosphatase HisJ family protein [Firmicutes bacterium]|nr:histidinol-phosphatase HisJ family protein [Bacillota bacterium]